MSCTPAVLKTCLCFHSIMNWLTKLQVLKLKCLRWKQLWRICSGTLKNFVRESRSWINTLQKLWSRSAFPSFQKKKSYLQFSCSVFLLQFIIIIAIIHGVVCISISTSFEKGNCAAGYYATNLVASFTVETVYQRSINAKYTVI